MRLNASKSGNWFGYDAGTLERGGTLFNAISGDWTVPTVSAHAKGRAGDSATWIGIGGGCLDAGCALADVTLIQAGTEQDVDSSGHAHYYAWWELVPAPAATIGNFNVSPGDHIRASIAELVPNAEVWTIALKDTTNGETFSTTVPYSSTHTTAEWIDEAPLSLGSDGVGQASLPNLTETRFTNATVNGGAAHLAPSEEVQLADRSGSVIATPSAPAPGAAGFADCAWATGCPTPASGAPAAGTRSGRAPVHRRTHRRRRTGRHDRGHRRH